MTWGPNNMLWVTERTAGRIIRVNPIDRRKQIAIEIGKAVSNGGQDRLLGPVFDPGLLKGTGHNFVFTALYVSPHVASGGPHPDRPARPLFAHLYQDHPSDL